MTPPATDSELEARLAALGASPAGDLAGRVVSHWVHLTDGPLPLYVAFSDAGVSFALTDAAAGDERGFVDAFHDQLGRPLVPSPTPPPGLRTALRRGDARGVRLDLSGLTSFEQDVLDAATHIPRGETRPYQWVAREVGRPRAVRAVGSALGRNPIPVLVPCHRVTRTDGGLGGYAFGLETKVALLAAERVDLEGAETLARRRVRFVASRTTGIFCWPTCASARRIRPDNRAELHSAAEADEAGYRSCQRCRPS